MKKLSLIIIVLLLSTLSLYASFTYGLDVAYHFQSINRTVNDKTVKYRNSGVSGIISLFYDFNEDWGIRGNGGYEYFGKTTINGTSYNDFIDSGFTFDFSLDAANKIPINSAFDFVTFFGLKMLMQCDIYKKINDYTDRFLLALGVNIGCEVAYKILNNVSLRLGADCAWLFYAKSPYFKEEGLNTRVNIFILKPYFGAGYSF